MTDTLKHAILNLWEPLFVSLEKVAVQPRPRARFKSLIHFCIIIVILARPSALVWSELRRQRELHEEKLKKRKQRFLEKRKKAGLDDVSEGGTYSVRSGRSGDIDEGFGVSMMSADITTATWGGSTQPSSTQNDSAVSADGSDDENQGGQVRFHKCSNEEAPLETIAVSVNDRLSAALE